MIVGLQVLYKHIFDEMPPKFTTESIYVFFRVAKNDEMRKKGKILFDDRDLGRFL
jgi:hypothetical protein